MLHLHDQAQGKSPTHKWGFIVIWKLSDPIYSRKDKGKRQLPIKVTEWSPTIMAQC